MPVIAVINRKGGSGKSTLAAHLAAFCASTGKRVMLGDVDRQQSAQTWLKLRGAQSLSNTASIQGWTLDPKNVLRAPAGVTHIVLDTPGGMRGFELARIVMNADVILMPVCNSVFDRDSAAECSAELKTLPRVASGRCKVAAIGMRLDARTKAAEVLAAWAKKLELPFIGVLRETQAYVRLIELGLTLFDVPAAQVKGDLAQWQSIVRWLEPILEPQAPQTAITPATVLKPEACASQAAVAAPPAQPIPLRPTRPIVAPTRPTAPRPAPNATPPARPAAPPARPRPVLTRTEPSRPALSARLEKLLDTLPIPRFLQRNP
jgi:chromosome partitioning protein